MLSVTSTKHPQIWYDMEVKDLERVSTGIILITRTCAALISLTPKKKFRKSALDFVYIVGQLKSLQKVCYYSETINLEGQCLKIPLLRKWVDPFTHRKECDLVITFFWSSVKAASIVK